MQARRVGAPDVAAVGTMLNGNVDHVRLAVLAVVLRARGWLEDALMQASPEFASDTKSAKLLLRESSPAQDRHRHGRIRCHGQESARGRRRTDPAHHPRAGVQQHVGKSPDHATDVAEAVRTDFSGRVLLVAVGQSALAAREALQWLRDRFRITVQLSDAEAAGSSPVLGGARFKAVAGEHSQASVVAAHSSRLVEARPGLAGHSPHHARVRRNGADAQRRSGRPHRPRYVFARARRCMGMPHSARAVAAGPLSRPPTQRGPRAEDTC